MTKNFVLTKNSLFARYLCTTNQEYFSFFSIFKWIYDHVTLFENDVRLSQKRKLTKIFNPMQIPRVENKYCLIGKIFMILALERGIFVSLFL